MSKLVVFDHPLIQHKLSIMRDKNTGVKEFRELLEEISMLMVYEVTRDLETEAVEVETPITTCTCRKLAGRKLAVVPILRAGLGMVDGVLNMVPAAKVGHIGLYRDPKTLEPVEYYCKLPADSSEREILVVDPMLATGGSASAAITFIKQRGCSHIRLVNLIAAPRASGGSRTIIPMWIFTWPDLTAILMITATSCPASVMPATVCSAPSNHRNQKSASVHAVVTACPDALFVTEYRSDTWNPLFPRRPHDSRAASCGCPP